jgi:hypothetical protein
MNLKQLLNLAGVRNDIAKAVEKKKLTEQQEEEVQEKAMALTKMMLNDALRYRKEHAKPEEPPFQKKIIVPND